MRRINVHSFSSKPYFSILKVGTQSGHAHCGHTQWAHIVGTHSGHTQWAHVVGTHSGHTQWAHLERSSEQWAQTVGTAHLEWWRIWARRVGTHLVFKECIFCNIVLYLFKNV